MLAGLQVRLICETRGDLALGALYGRDVTWLVNFNDSRSTRETTKPHPTAGKGCVNKVNRSWSTGFPPQKRAEKPTNGYRDDIFEFFDKCLWIVLDFF